jgi:La domain
MVVVEMSTNNGSHFDNGILKNASSNTKPVLINSESIVAEGICSADTSDPLLLQQLEEKEAHDELYRTLARQIEYYFSPQNLRKDTYLRTLRELNDGYVPVSILANFCKVKVILSRMTSSESLLQNEPNSKALAVIQGEKRRVDAILQVVHQSYSDQLHICYINTQTGKVVSDDTQCNTLLAIGVKSISLAEKSIVSNDLVVNESTHLTDVVLSSANSCEANNTLILRDVDSCVSEEEISSLLDSVQDCPIVTKIVPDIANCW